MDIDQLLAALAVVLGLLLMIALAVVPLWLEFDAEPTAH